MKGTIYIWVIVAILSGALVGFVGFLVQQFFNLPPSRMEPIIIGAMAGVVAVLITFAVFRNGK